MSQTQGKHKGKHTHIYLKKGIFQASQGGAQFKVSDRTEPVQEYYIVDKPSSPPVVFGYVW